MFLKSQVMNKKMKDFINILSLILYVTVMSQCTKEDKPLKKSKEASIISFELGTYKGKLNGTSLLIEVPYAADISSLSAKVKLSEKATIKPDPTKVKDWSNPVSFTVTAENGESKKYTVTVKILRPVLTFEKLTKEYTKGGHLNATEILNHVKGAKDGYTLKEITNLNPNDIVTVNGSAPNLRLAFNRVGVFTASLRLKHNVTSDLDVTLSNAQFEITKGDAPSDLNWRKQSKVYALGGEISNVELLGGVSGPKEGYRIKSVQITDDSSSSGARVSGSGTAAKIVSYSKPTILTLTLVFEHDTKADKTITGAQFEITEGLTWRKQSKVYRSGGEISNAELLGGLQGPKEGYRIKSVQITNDSSTSGARVSGSGTAAKIINYNKAVTLTLTLVFEHATKAEKTITGAQFEITKMAAPTNLTWVKQLKTYRSGQEISNAELLEGLEGSKVGYRIKSVAITSDSSSSGARVSGSGTAAKIINYSKATILTLTLVFEHDTKVDKTITGAQFELTSGAVSVPLTWSRQSKVYSVSGEISNVELLDGVRGTKDGYRIKSVQITNDSGGSGARVSGSGTAAKIVDYGKATILTLTLVLQHDTKADKTLSSAVFEIRKMPVPADLTWRKQNKVYSAGGEISNAALLNGLSGTKTGYRIKTVTISNKAGTGARVSGNGTSAKIVSYTKAGTLTLSIVFEHDTKEDKNITGAEFEITKMPVPDDLTWRKQSKPYSDRGEISNAELLRGLSGTKTGYTIKSVSITHKNGTSATVSGSGTAAKIVGYRKAGTLTLSIIFEHDTKADKTIAGAQFEITKGAAPSNLSWGKQSKPYSDRGEISNAELLNGLGGTKTGYRIKSVQITRDSSSSGASVSGSGTAAKIVSYSKPTILTLTLVFEHDTKADKTITGAQFELTSGAVSVPLSWNRQSKVYSPAGEISNAALLNGVRGTKTGYRIKTVQIANDSSSSGARVSGSGTAAKIIGYGKATILTLTLVLQHATKGEKTLSNAQFEIRKMPVPADLSWRKQIKVYSDRGEISNRDLLAGLNGTKTGYRIKTVNISDAGGTGARVSGNGNSAKIVSYTKAGTLTLSIVFENDTKQDKNITGAEFEITKASAPPLSWRKQTKPFSSSGEITNGNLLAGVTGSGKNGYTIKTVRITNTNGTGARVSGSGRAAKITNYNKIGTLTLTIILQHDTKNDVTLTGAQFEITKGTAESLSWTKQTKAFSSGGEITNGNLLAGITGSGKTGYTIKTVTITSTNGTGARVSGSGRAAKITSYLKIGTLTLTLVLAHDTKNDVTLTGAQFEIIKGGAESLTWTKQTKAFSSSGEITNAQLLAGVTGSGKNGYTIKTVNITNKNGTNATVSGSGRAAKITSYNKIGTLTLTIVLEHPGKSDATISNAQFHIYRDVFKISSGGEVTLKTGVNRNSLTTVTIPYMINGITVTSIGLTAFKDCINLTRITIPNSVTSIGNEAFHSCISLTRITIPNSVTSIGNSTFYDCDELTSITIPNSVTSIGNSAFYGCDKLTSITIPNSVTSIENNTFTSCISLTSITIPNSVISIGDQAFNHCTKLTSITIPNSVTSIGNSAFYNCKKLTSITIGNFVTSIGGSAFWSCTSLTSITIPNSVTSIGNNPFYNCSKLTNIYVPSAKVSRWEDNLKHGNRASVVGY